MKKRSQRSLSTSFRQFHPENPGSTAEPKKSRWKIVTQKTRNRKMVVAIL